LAKSKNIFAKRRLTPNQLRAVAEMRSDDAKVLLECGQKARANGAMYLGGFVIECLLKALLLERHPNLMSPVDPAKLSKDDRDVLNMLYGHDLADMLDFLPEVRSKLVVANNSANQPIWQPFRDICEEWSVFARFATTHASLEDAKRFLATINEVKQWLKEL
jgi:hypothetical protein